MGRCFRDGTRIRVSDKNNRTTSRLTFSGTNTSHRSIADGVYSLATDGSKVHGGGTTMSGTRTDVVDRRFGDVDAWTIGSPNSNTINTADSLEFNNSYLNPSNYKLYFDYDGDSDVDASDRTEFLSGFNQPWTWTGATTDLIAFTSKRYDAAGQVVKSLSGNVQGTDLDDFTYAYDGAGRVTLQGHNGIRTTFTYDALDQVSVEQASTGSTTSYAYDPAGNRSTVSVAAGVATYTAGADNRYGADGTWNYTYDAEGNLTGKTNITPTDLNGSTWAYGYDNRNQMILAEHASDGSHVDLRDTYKYDPWGNRIAKSVDSDGDGYAWTASSQYASSVQAYSSQDASSPATGAVGAPDGDVWSPSSNVASDITLNFATAVYPDGLVIDEEQEFPCITRIDLVEPGGTIHTNFWSGTDTTVGGLFTLNFAKLSYQVNRIRIYVDNSAHSGDTPLIGHVQLITHSATSTGNASAVETKYALDGWNPMKAGGVGNENFDVWADLSSAGSLLVRYLRSDIVDEILGRYESSGSVHYWYMTDRLGSVRAVVDNSGNVKDTLEYDAYGNITKETNSTYRGRYAWTGREFDVETGLQYNRARYYDPKLGRWTSKDPLGFDAGDSNLYRYVRNAPTNATDPSGLQGPVPDFDEYLKNLKRSYDSYDGKDLDQLLPQALSHLSADRRNIIATFDLPTLKDRVHPGPATLDALDELKKQKGIVISPDDPTALKKFHPGASCGFRIFDPAKDKNAGNQVTYDSKGKLITSGPAAGTPDLSSPWQSNLAADHLLVDVIPFQKLGWVRYHKAGWAPVNDPNAPVNWGDPPK